ncbi:hypothetical protein [Streptomyces sp. AC550_RSS872]|uniref:hypothetical protein n=1 Tax=Streptomyces sp. AC550_RSS872 TaxID=2823689 RepID=UPI0020B734FB|nr:hypothetical protein [Streptomyces sp. AC550_RSS872]
MSLASDRHFEASVNLSTASIARRLPRTLAEAARLGWRTDYPGRPGPARLPQVGGLRQLRCGQGIRVGIEAGELRTRRGVARQGSGYRQGLLA